MQPALSRFCAKVPDCRLHRATFVRIHANADCTGPIWRPSVSVQSATGQNHAKSPRCSLHAAALARNHSNAVCFRAVLSEVGPMQSAPHRTFCRSRDSSRSETLCSDHGLTQSSVTSWDSFRLPAGTPGEVTGSFASMCRATSRFRASNWASRSPLGEKP